MIPRHGDFFDDPDMAEQLVPDEVWAAIQFHRPATSDDRGENFAVWITE
jgi:hypothetical protein